MRRDITTSVLAILVFTVLLGLAYPLATTGLAQVLWPNKADGSTVMRDGKVVGSRLIGQDFKGRPRYFQSRPSVTGYDAAATLFNNLGPNSKQLAAIFRKNLSAYLKLERPYTPGLTKGVVPPDAVQTSGSGVDPHISKANAEIQANRVAAVRGLPLARVKELIDQNTDGRGLGVFGDPGVNVVELNGALGR